MADLGDVQWPTRLATERLLLRATEAHDRAGYLGTVILHWRDPDRPGHTRPEGLELEVSYTLLPRWWGMGYATEAVHAALAWAREATSETNVLLCTQVANERAMAVAQRLGFTELDRFTEFNARQWLGIRDL